MLDIDEYGITYNSGSKNKGKGITFSSMYLALEEIIINERSFTITIKGKKWDSVIDLKKLDGDLWSNFLKIRNTISDFAGNILVLVSQP